MGHVSALRLMRCCRVVRRGSPRAERTRGAAGEPEPLGRGVMRKIVLSLIMTAIGFCLGAVTFYLILSNRPPITITLKNDSSKDIEAVQIIQSQSSPSIPSKTSLEEKLYVAGEAEYSLLVKFKDGNTLTGGGGYSESGYKMTEQITDTGIKTDRQHGRY